MRRILCSLFLAGSSLILPATGLHAEEPREEEKRPTEEPMIDSEDRQVIRMMELLQRMELLRDMELLEGAAKTILEEKEE